MPSKGVPAFDVKAIRANFKTDIVTSMRAAQELGHEFGDVQAEELAKRYVDRCINPLTQELQEALRKTEGNRYVFGLWSRLEGENPVETFFTTALLLCLICVTAAMAGAVYLTLAGLTPGSPWLLWLIIGTCTLIIIISGAVASH